MLAAVTSTLTVQLAPAATEPPDRLTTPEPAAAVSVPLQPLLLLAGVATSMPAGRLSVKSSVVAATGLLVLLITKLKVETPPAAIAAGEKDLLNVGATVALSESLAVPLLPRSEVRSPDTLT